MTLTYNDTENSYTYTIKDEYISLLDKGDKGIITIKIDSTNFNCNTCDIIFEKVFNFVNENYKEPTINNGDDDVDFDKEFGEIYSYNTLQPNNLFDILKKKATDTLITQMNKKIAVIQDNALHKNILTGLNEKAKDTLQTQMKEKIAVIQDNALHKNILTGLNEKAKDTLITQMKEKIADIQDNALHKNILTGLNEKAKDTLQTQINKKIAVIQDNALHKNILTGLNEKATDTLQTQMKEKIAVIQDNALHKNILTGLNEKATDTLQTQINKKLAGEENNKCVEGDSKENDVKKLKNEDGVIAKLKLTIKDYNKNNKITQLNLTVKEIIDALNKKTPRNKHTKRYSNNDENVDLNTEMETKKRDLINDLTNATTVGEAVKILKDSKYDVNLNQKDYNQCYNEFINTLYSNHPFNGGDNTDIENENEIQS